MKVQVILAAGGYGKRMGSKIPKQMMDLCGKPVILRTVEPFLKSSIVDGIVIVAYEETIPLIKNIVSRVENIPDIDRIKIIKGGRERQESVSIGLSQLPEDTDIVLIHDAVRPFITEKLIGECISAAEEYGAVTVMRPVKETVKIVKDSFVINTIDRSTVWITQTPQAFRFDIIKDAHKKAVEDGFSGTDDAMLVERMGKDVFVIEGSDTNIKITTKTDFIAAENILKNSAEIDNL